MGDVEISTLDRSDLPALGKLFEAHAGRPADLEILGAWIDDWPSAAARRRGRLVGYLVTTRFAPDLIEVASMQVAADARGQGIGRRLVGHVGERCRERGMAGLITVTSTAYVPGADRRDPVSFYVELGFRVVLETAASTVLVRALDGDD